MDCSLTGSSIPGIFQVRILEWVAISSSRGSSQPRDQTYVSYIARWILSHSGNSKARKLATNLWKGSTLPGLSGGIGPMCLLYPYYLCVCVAGLLLVVIVNLGAVLGVGTTVI